jgi:hypothetical protein
MIITLLIISLIALMFYNPYIPRDYRPKSEYKPTRIQRYISTVNKLIDKGRYGLVIKLLSTTKYPRQELPWEYWRSEISDEITRIETQSMQLENLRNLEKILGF